MRVVLAKASGFCDGVKRAMRMALEASSRHGGLRTAGPLVHNRTAVDLLSLHGISATADRKGLPLLVRAHGITPLERLRWTEEGVELVDATCVHVARNQRLAAEAAASGETVIIAGDADHAEVQAVAGSAGSGCLVISSVDDIERLPPCPRPFMLAQTTFNVALFEQMARSLRRRRPDCRVVDTICRATHDRQEEARSLARQTDAVVVVGGTHSANTRRLAETVISEGKPAFTVETAADLRAEDLRGFFVVGVTSGASTPGWITQEVVTKLRQMGGGTVMDRLSGWLIPLIRYRVTTALSAAGLALAAQRYLLGAISPALAVAGAGFVLFAHTLNRRVPKNPEARRVSHADDFYLRRRDGMLALAWVGATCALILSALAGGKVFALFACAVLATTGYAAISRKRNRIWRGYVSSSPARHLAMAAGWAMTLAGPPTALSHLPIAGSGAALFVFLICFAGTLVRDLHDMASDKLMGIDTLPAVLGPKRARRLAGAALVFAALLPLLAIEWNYYCQINPVVNDTFVYLLPLSPGFGVYLLRSLRYDKIRDAISLQGAIECMGMMAGLLALLF